KSYKSNYESIGNDNKAGQATMDSDEEEEVVPDTYEGMALPESTGATDDNNPWIQSSSKRKADNEVNEDGETFDEFTSSYKKFWSETNKEKSVEKIEEMEQADEKEDDSQTEEVVKSKKVDKSSPVSKEKQETDDSPLKKKASESGTKPPKSANEKNQIKLEAKTTSIEERERLELAESIDDLFCEAQSLVKEKMKKKMKLLKADIKGDKTALESEEDAEGSPEVFEELAHAESLKFETDRDHSAKVVRPNKGVIGEVPALEDDEEEEEGMRQVIAEAFADDDVIEKDFKAEKDALLEANKTQVINKVLPGWDPGVGMTLRHPHPNSKDANKGHLILNENKNSAVLEHQVSNDYEASIRTPVGETFVPRTVFKRLTKPKTKTSAGVIIEPMDKEELVKRGLT
ncbi:Smooth muscle caldesmon_ putativelike, partial [Caligus rogercresseyi]